MSLDSGVMGEVWPPAGSSCSCWACVLRRRSPPAELQPATEGDAPVLVLVQEEEELPPEIPVRNAAGLEPAVPELLLEGDARDAAEAQPRLDRPLDRLGVL